MGRYTKEGMRRIHEMRGEMQAEWDQRADEWNAAQPGYTEGETVYVIEYREGTDSTWLGASPFFDPVRPDPSETHNKEEARIVAVELLKHKRAVYKESEPGKVNVTAVRVIERYNSATVLNQLHSDVSRETKEETS